ncbi:MAG: dienelactone hydrolase family protein, partial [Longimicrobiales bacterium]
AYYALPIARQRVKAQKTLEWAKTRPWFSTLTDWRELRGVGDSVPSLGYVMSPAFDTTMASLRRDAAYEPMPSLQRVHVPLLALFGGADHVVPNDMSIAAMKTAFAVSGNTKLTVHVFPDANHGLMVAGNAFAPGYLRMLADWINANSVGAR